MIHRLRTDPSHRKISATKRQLKQDDDMSDDETGHYAIQKRQCLIQKATDTLSKSEFSDSFERDDNDDNNESSDTYESEHENPHVY